MDKTANAIWTLRAAAGGSDPWCEIRGGLTLGGFAWRDDQGNRFDVRVLPAGGATGPGASDWQRIMLGDDTVRSTDPLAWRFAMECRNAADEAPAMSVSDILP
jgi:hypothetical protein